MRIAYAMRQSIGTNMVITGHSLGGGLASAASMASGVHADTFNAAGLRIETVNAVSGLYPNVVDRYNNAAAYVDAYYLDWDILSYVQDNSPMQNAIGNRIPMDGPVDAEIAVFGALSFVPLPGAWLVSLGGAGYYMGLAHTTGYYFYGLMVREDSWGGIEWDIYGEDFY
jgi:hypothetical protein